MLLPQRGEDQAHPLRLPHALRPRGEGGPGRPLPGDSPPGLPGPQAALGAHRGENRRGRSFRRIGLHPGGADYGPCHEAAGPPPDGYHRRHHALLRHHGPDEEQRRPSGGADGGKPADRGHHPVCPQPLPGHRPRPGGPLRHL